MKNAGVFLLCVAAMISCRSRDTNSEISYDSSDPYKKTGALLALGINNYDASTYTFEGKIAVIDKANPRFDGRHLYCYNYDTEFLATGKGITLVNPFYEGKVTKARTIPCWDDFSKVFDRYKARLERWQVDAFSKIQCSAAKDNETVGCRRLNWFDKKGSQQELFKGVKLIVGPTGGDKPHPNKKISPKSGDKVPATLMLEGMTQFDGQPLYCANKRFISYHSNDVTTEYVMDYFVWTGSLREWVTCYLSEAQLQATADKKAGFGSLVSCPQVAENQTKVECTFTEEISFGAEQKSGVE